MPREIAVYQQPVACYPISFTALAGQVLETAHDDVLGMQFTLSSSCSTCMAWCSVSAYCHIRTASLSPMLRQRVCKTAQVYLPGIPNRGHWFLCLLRAAQLPSQGCLFNPVLLDHYCCLHRSATSATVVSCGGEPAHRKVCCLACCACSHRRNNTALRSQYCRNLQTWGPGTLFTVYGTDPPPWATLNNFQ